MTRIAIATAALAALIACTGEKESYPNPTPANQPQAAAPPAGAPSAAPAPAPGGAPAAAPGAPAAGAPAAGGAPSAPITEADRAEAAQTFSTLCSTCHGPNGDGTGPAAAAFPVKPRNFHDATWQKSVTDAQIEKTILEGGAAVGKSPLMPPNPQFASKPGVIAALREKVRSFGK